ncbi:MAG: recombinase family protein [Coprococcus sp.]
MSSKHFLAAMYLRLSRDDRDIGDITDRKGTVKLESNSIGNQRELIRTFIQEQKDIELYDVYVDDGFSGSNFDRPEFKRMISDIEEGRVNLVIVKDLSRFGRDYIETGRYIQKIFPALGVRFIAVTDHYDSFKADSGESGIILPVRNFINDSYCRDISAKVKSQFEVKRKNGDCIAPFAPYGYMKDKNNRNKLVVDCYAAEVVRKIFAWKIEGMANSAIAEKLNELCILSPKEYKKSVGTNYKGGFAGKEKAQWSSTTVKRILTNEIYIGHMVQGKTEKINYKLKKIIEKPQKEWIKVEDTHEPIISENSFEIVRNLLCADSRTSPISETYSLFSGILFCGDCGEQMIRRVSSYKNKQKLYYICSTKNRGDGCTRHSITEEKLKELVFKTVTKYANLFMEEKKVHQKALEAETIFVSFPNNDIERERLKYNQEKYCLLCAGLHDDLSQKVITEEEYERLYSEFKRKADNYMEAGRAREIMTEEMINDSRDAEKQLEMMQTCAELKKIDRHTLCTMIKKINIFEDKRLEIEFYYTDGYQTMWEVRGDGKSFQKESGRKESGS